ncbi:MAG TPA: ABC transporter permease [Actinopolymorphaceae bacterium]|jgi:ABC-type dipeptide/oligopeptide/nickel transport system permease subunit
MTDPTTAANIAAESHGGPVARSLWAEAFRTLSRRPSVIIAAVVVAFFVVVAAFPTLFTRTDPQRCDIRQSKIRPQWFDGPHPFGTDLHGCDLLAQLVHGARPSLLLAAIVVGSSVLIGLVLGSLAGYYLGVIDAVVSRAVEVFLVIPLLLAALLVLSIFRNVDFGDGQLAVLAPPAIVLTMFAWMGYTRYVRASVLETKNLDYVVAARVLGASDLRIIFRHILPNAIAPVTALIPTAVAGIIAAEATLAFLGIGVRPPAISWGIMISNSTDWFTGGYPHLLLFPLACLIATILALVVLGDALRDALDPKLR